MRKIFSALTIAATAGTFAMPALATDFIGKSNIDFFYAELEGGYSAFDGASTIGSSISLQPDGGAYGTVTLGHVSIDDGIIYGYVDRAELWFSYFDHGDDSLTVPGLSAKVDRDYWEVGTRFQHYYDQNATNKMMWGFEPFYGEFSDNVVQITAGPTTATVDVDTSIYGALLSFEYERTIAPATMLLFRAAGGVYGLNSDMNISGATTGSDSESTAGFRGQLALGLKHQVNERTSVGVVGRLDYFSDVARFDSTSDSNVITTDDLLGASIGVNLNYIFGGTYQ
ncbi:MAG: hypothetical protein R3D43_08900 [Tepidamorphaceae bacterium]